MEISEIAKKKAVDIHGHRHVYWESGQGEPILLLHGITTYSFIWQEVIPYLARDYRVIAVDLLGCGASDKPLDVSYGLNEHAQRTVAFVRALGLEKVHLVGHDLGGGIAQIMAVNHPELFRELTLVNSVGYAYWPVQPITALRTPIIRQLIMASLDLGTFELVIRRAVHHKERLTDALLAQFFAPLTTREGRKAFLLFARSLDNRNLTDLESRLRRLPLQTLIIHGAEDAYLSIEIAEQLHRDIPENQYHIFQKSGHFVQIDEPEKLAHTILAFYQ